MLIKNPPAKLLVLFFIILFSSCTKQPLQKPNVIYILTDQWRASAFGFAGDPIVKTPHIDRFARESIRFTNAVSVTPVCTPYRAALMTGRYPTSTGMFLNDLYLPDEALCMAEIFKSAGYNTAYLGKWHLDGHGRLNNVDPERRQGFDFWKALECSHDYNKMPYYEHGSSQMKYWQGYSPFAISKAAQDYLREQAESEVPFLLFISIATPHFPHATAPQEYKDLYPESEIKIPPNVPAEYHQKVRKELNGYYAHCSATDKAIGDVIAKVKELGLLDHSIIVFTSDHGEMMGAHGMRPKSKQAVWDESVLVPFLIRYPLIRENEGIVVDIPITTPDILPSLLGLANLDIPKTIEGEDLSRLMKSPATSSERGALFMHICPFSNEHILKEYRGIRTKQYSYVRTIDGASMMYDHVQDPFQMNNLVGKKEFSEIERSLEKKLQTALKTIGDEDFRPRNYYLEKWNLKLNRNGTHIDYHGFTTGKGVVQSPKITEDIP
jgi:arylsulfatase A-like enzyme